MNFKNVESLAYVEKVINEASEAMQDKARLIDNSVMSDDLRIALDYVNMGSLKRSLDVKYCGQLLRLGPSLIASSLAMASISMPLSGKISKLVLLTFLTGFIGKKDLLKKQKQKSDAESTLDNEDFQTKKESCLDFTSKKQKDFIEILKEEINADKNRLDYLNAVNFLLQSIQDDLKQDLGIEM